MIVAGSASPLLLSSAGGYNLTKSLRFRASAGAYLNRTFSSGDQQKFTLSLWVKRGTTGMNRIFTCGSSGSSYFQFRFDSDDKILISSENPSLVLSIGTSQLFRDYSAWYHLVLAVDTTQATASNRVRLYVNGTEVTAFSSATYPSQNTNLLVNSNIAHYIGELSYALTNGYDGYMTEINFIGGQQLTPSSFGQTSPSTGVWQPIKYTGTYGTNGFYLPFTNTTSTTTLGNDFSGNGNNWTTNNISLTSGVTYDSMNDVPTLTNATTANYCTLNPIIPIPRGTIAQGNLNYLSGSTSSHGSVAATFTLPTTGKWYWEVTACNNSGGSGNNEAIGVANILNNPQLPAAGSEIGSGSRGDYAYRSDGNKYSNGNQGAYGATYTNGDVIGVAWDSDSGTITFYKNNVSQGTAFSSITQVAGKFAPASSNAETSNGDNYNFGQRPFSYTPPTGFVALNTFNLPTPTIGATASTVANKYMDATLYTGNGSTQSITNAGGFQPDLVWYKGRSTAYNHRLFDVIRGVTKDLQSNSTDAEGTISGLTAFNSNGFSLGSEVGGNNNGTTYVAWQWRASNATAVTNTAGSITSTVSANTTAGFSIVTYTGTGANATVGHGLGVAPSMIIAKCRSAGGTYWIVGHSSLSSWDNYLNLNTTGSFGTLSSVFNSTAPTSTVFSLGSDSNINGNSATNVAYCFAQVAGYSAFGSYTGNGSTDGVFIYTGFRPRFVMYKNASYAGTSWAMLDSSRNTYNVLNARLFADGSDAENTATTPMDFTSNGFKVRSTNDGVNRNGDTIIYMAFAESPFKYANAR